MDGTRKYESIVAEDMLKIMISKIAWGFIFSFHAGTASLFSRFSASFVAVQIWV